MEPKIDEKSGRIQLTPEQRSAFEDLMVLHDQMQVGGTDHKEPVAVIKQTIALIAELGVRVWRQEKELSDMTLMRNALFSQLESEGIDPVVRIAGGQRLAL